MPNTSSPNPALQPVTQPTTPLGIAMRYFPVTLFLMVMCIGLFAVQILTGVNATEPSGADLLKWGANLMPYTLHNEPWRMVTSLFLHIGFLHLLFNMFALYYFGQVAERMFGSRNLMWLFLLAGIGGNLLNNFLAWQAFTLAGEPSALSAGASGGIMGIGAALLVAAVAKMQFNELQLKASTLVWVMAINLGYGFFVQDIDNAGHVGGAIVGILLGMAYVYFWKKFPANPMRVRLYLVGLHVALLAIMGLMYWQLHTAFSQVEAVSRPILS